MGSIGIGIGIGISGVQLAGGGGCAPVFEDEGSVSAGVTFVHPTDAIIAWTMTALPSTTTDRVQIDFRAQDNNNKWQVRCLGTQRISLVEYVAGVTAQRAVMDTAYAAGDRIVVELSGSDITCRVNGEQIWQYTSALYATATGGDVDNIPTGAVVSDLRVWSLACADQEAFAVTIASPVAYQVIQRDGSNQADIVINGSYTGTPTAIEASFNGGSYATIDASPSGGTYSGTLSAQAAGQGTLTVRFVNATATSASVTDVGIGDVFVVGGQSNASGRGTNNQTYSHATLTAALFGNNYAWSELSDPTDSNSGQVDTVSSDGATGSCWPLLATQIMAQTGYPVAFVPAAKGGTSIADWQPDTDHQDRSTLYGSMVYRANQVGGVKAVLWWQGERDAVLGTAEATYNSGLDTVANAVNTDLDCKLVVCKIEDLSTYTPGYDESAVNAAIATAWSDNANVVAGPDFSDITPSVDGVHFVTDGELQTAADRWFTALDTAGLV